MGPRDDWFRRSTWCEEDQVEFEQRLKRARAHSQPQYLRIQAWHLAETGNRDLLPAAISLTDRALADYPDDLFVAMVHELRAECYERLGQPLRALQCYREALEAQRQQPNVQSGAWLGFGWLAIRLDLSSLYPEAMWLLEEFATTLAFPYQRYRYHAIRAIAFADGGYAGQARAEAILALEAAGATHSGFRYHPTAGLVQESSDAVRSRLAVMAAS